MLNGDEPVVTGGDAPVIIDPWVPAEDDLAALEYRYTVPCRREDRLAPSA